MSNKQIITAGMAAGDFVFVSGQASVDESGKIVTESFSGECRRSLKTLERSSKARGWIYGSRLGKELRSETGRSGRIE